MSDRLPLCNSVYFTGDCIVPFVSRVLWFNRAHPKFLRALPPSAFKRPRRSPPEKEGAQRLGSSCRLGATPVERRDAVNIQSEALAQKVPHVADRVATQLALPLFTWNPVPSALFDLNWEQPQARHREQACMVLTVNMRKVWGAGPACPLLLALLIRSGHLH